jgi:hypothetical protein
VRLADRSPAEAGARPGEFARPFREHRFDLRLAPTDRSLSIRTDDEHLAAYIRAAYGELTAPGSFSARSAHEAVLSARHPAGFTFDGVPLPRPAPDDLTDRWNSAAYAVDQCVWRALSGDSAWRAIYGCAVVFDRSAVLIIGPTGAGKTTLSLALRRRGAQIYGDEIALWHRARGTVTALARRIAVREPSLTLLDDARATATVHAEGIPFAEPRGRIFFVARGALGAIPLPSPLRAIVGLRHSGTPSVQTLSTARAGLMLSPYLGVRPDSLDELASLAQEFAGVPAFAVTLGTPDAAAAAVLEVLARC